MSLNDNSIIESFNKLKNYCENENFKGWDPFDGLNSSFFQSIPLIRENRFFRLVWIQLFKRNPINFRTFMGVKKGYNAKGLGLFLMGYCNLYQINQKEEYLVQINFLAKKLIRLQSNGYSGACWGYNFDWQARAFFQPKGTPTVVATSFIANALFKAYEITKVKTYYEVALDTENFILKDLNRSYDKDGDFSFSYSPLDKTQVYNASLLGARLLAQIYSYTKEDILLKESKKAVNYVCKSQYKEGSWSYGTLPFHQWIDSFHTGYNLECLNDYQKFTGETEYNENINKGLDYYLNNFFTKEGLSKYYNNRAYPIDIHAPAQLIVTLSNLNALKDNKKLVSNVLDWVINNMQSKQGYFYYQFKKGLISKISYMRWGQAWMFYAFSFYLLKSNEK